MSRWDILKKFASRVGYSSSDLDVFTDGDPRLRLLEKMADAAPLYSIQAEVVEARHCNTGYTVGDRFVLDLDGNFITSLCPKKMCVYAVSQLAVPVALIVERISEGLDPNAFHFMHYVRCPDVGVQCAGYGGIMMKIEVIPRR